MSFKVRVIALAAMMALPAIAAQADRLTLSAPLAGGTLHTPSVDMTAYWTRSDDAFEVVAFYAPTSDLTDVSKLQMRLADGDGVTFSLPGLKGMAYRFERRDEAVSITSIPTTIQQAMAD